MARSDPDQVSTPGEGLAPVKRIGSDRPMTPALMFAALSLGVATVWAQSGASAPPSVPTAGQRIALVTGSTDGLGREVARRLAAEGAHVIVHGRNVERGKAVVAEITASGTGS
ncbi:MAG TPA: SDR family NAD(P)-dependent oxidoreductase, partial [Verrucomicrobiales bacterium]|nr:SDR family NAD(P)-dependent oxidoreductase [Verrucomicrobiales bacterium]